MEPAPVGEAGEENRGDNEIKDLDIFPEPPPKMLRDKTDADMTARSQGKSHGEEDDMRFKELAHLKACWQGGVKNESQKHIQGNHEHHADQGHPGESYQG